MIESEKLTAVAEALRGAADMSRMMTNDEVRAVHLDALQKTGSQDVALLAVARECYLRGLAAASK